MAMLHTAISILRDLATCISRSIVAPLNTHSALDRSTLRTSIPNADQASTTLLLSARQRRKSSIMLLSPDMTPTRFIGDRHRASTGHHELQTGSCTKGTIIVSRPFINTEAMLLMRKLSICNR